MIYCYLYKKIKKFLSVGKKEEAGRNFKGRICIRGRGNGHKILYRFIDFYRRINKKGRVIRIIYDSNRTSMLSLILYSNGLSCYNLKQKGIMVNDWIYSGTENYNKNLVLDKGFSLPLKIMPLYSVLSNIETVPFEGGKIARAANTSVLFVGKDKNKAFLKLNSGWNYKISLDCISSLGSIDFKFFNNIYIDKAGKNRALGWKPKVRGVAKNPCDHPHGGGNGKKGKPVMPTNAWCSVFKWKHTKSKVLDKLVRRKFKF